MVVVLQWWWFSFPLVLPVSISSQLNSKYSWPPSKLSYSCSDKITVVKLQQCEWEFMWNPVGVKNTNSHQKNTRKGSKENENRLDLVLSTKQELLVRKWKLAFNTQSTMMVLSGWVIEKGQNGICMPAQSFFFCLSVMKARNIDPKHCLLNLTHWHWQFGPVQ